MTRPKLADDFMSVVIRGIFTPREFTPRWLHSAGLIGSVELNQAEMEMLIPDQATIFRAQWLNCSVQTDAIQISTSDEREFERLRDIATGMLRERPDAPISVLGINRQVNFYARNANAYHAIGDAIAPKEVWSDILDLPGLRSTTIAGVRPDKYAGRVEVRVEPSLSVRPGVFVACNDHYELRLVDHQPASRDDEDYFGPDPTGSSVDKNPIAIQILSDEWNASAARAEAIIARQGGG